MKPVKMVDLQGQYQRIKPEVDARIQEVIDATAFINGPQVKEFENRLEEYLDVREVVGCGNGTDALQIALMALELREGDEVIVPDFTFVATIEVVVLLGLRPVIVDVDPDTFCMDPEGVKEAISDRTRALIPVHLFGQCADMESLMNIARDHGLYIVEDAAQALGAECYFSDGTIRKAGAIGDIGCTSFFPSKNLGAFGDGGAMVTNTPELGERMRSIAGHGKGSHKYFNERVGVNSRLDTLQAAILKVKLDHLDAYARARQEAAAFYDKALKAVKGLKLPVRSPHSTHVFHQYTLCVEEGGDREKLRTFLSEREIPTMIYYPVPLHKQKPYRSYRAKEGSGSVTASLCEKVLSLPMHTELEGDQLTYITENLSAGLKN